MITECKRTVTIRGPLFFTKSRFQIESLKYLGSVPVEIVDGKFARFMVDATLIANLNAIANNVHYVWSGPIKG